MKQDYKIQCYQESYQELKNIPQVKNLQYPEEKKNLDFSCDILNIHVEYSMRLGIDFLTIRGSRPYPGCTDSELTKIGQKLVEGTAVKFTAYSETLIFQLSLPLVGIADEDAKAFAIKESSDFFKFLFGVVGVTDTTANIDKKKESEESTPSKGEDKGKLSQEKILSEKSVSQKSDESSNNARIERANDTESDCTNLEKETISDNQNMKAALSEERLVVQKDKIKHESNVEENKVYDAGIVNSNEKITEEHIHEENELEEKTISHSKEKVESRRNELEYLIAMRSENNRKEAELKKLQEEYKAREMDLLKKEDMLHDTLLQLEEEKKELAAELDKINDIKEKSQNEVKQVFGKLEEKEKNITDLQKRVTDLQAQCDKSQHDNNKLKLSNTKLRENMAENESVINGLHVEIEQMNQLLQEGTSWSNRLQSEKDKLIQKLAEKDLEIESIKNEIASISNSLKQEKEIVFRQSEDLLKEHEKFEALNKKHTEAILENESMKQAFMKMQSEQEALIKVKEDSNNRLTKLENEITSKCEIINDLENRLQQYRNGSSLGTPDEVLEDFAETRKENRRLQREIEDLKAENETNEEALLKEIEKLNLEIKQRKEADAETAKLNTMEYKIKEIIAELASLGVMVSEDASGELIGKRDGVNITIVPNKDMFICKVPVARAAKYQNDINKWNEEEITEMYYSSKREIICKKKFDKIAIDLQKILRKFVLLK